jgi:hypothetical protein
MPDVINWATLVVVLDTSKSFKPRHIGLFRCLVSIR